MSTFATTVWIDVRPEGPVPHLAEGLESLRDLTLSRGTQRERIWVDVEVGWVRLTTYLAFGIGLVDRIAALLAPLDWARAVIAEDNDEYGACWVVLAAQGGRTSTVHRRYILNADPRRRRQVRRALKDFIANGDTHDPRADDVAGARAATEAARLFGVEPGPVVEAEVRSVAAFEGIGTVGGPFPWVEALGLTWPGPEAGRPMGPRS